MSKPTGKSDPIQSERDAMRKANVRKRGGAHINCERCGQLLAISYGNHLDFFSCTVWHRVKMKCEACGGEKRWGPGKATAFNADLETAPPITETNNAPLPIDYPKTEE